MFAHVERVRKSAKEYIKIPIPHHLSSFPNSTQTHQTQQQNKPTQTHTTNMNMDEINNILDGGATQATQNEEFEQHGQGQPLFVEEEDENERLLRLMGEP